VRFLPVKMRLTTSPCHRPPVRVGTPSAFNFAAIRSCLHARGGIPRGVGHYRNRLKGRGAGTSQNARLAGFSGTGDPQALFRSGECPKAETPLA
jgi:hypothetical protein